MTTLLQKMTAESAAKREELRLTVRADLHSALLDLVPGMPVTVFGSLVGSRPPDCSVYQLIALLSERLGRKVDIILLRECRSSEKFSAKVRHGR